MAMSTRIFRKVTKIFPSLNARFISVSPNLKPVEENALDNRFLRYSSPEPAICDHSNILRFPKTRITTLPNGIRVVTQTSPSCALHTATVGVWIDAGSRFETPKNNGTAHFLEHIIFKGTKRRTSQALEVEVENMGGRLNAYTSREQTTFYTNILRGDLPVGMDILSDILQNSSFADRAIKRERDVILREMEEVQEQMEEVIFDHLHSAAFKNQPLGQTILGPPENIKTISKNDLHDYISIHYTGHRMVVSAAGAVEHEDMVKKVYLLFDKLSRDPTTASQLVQECPAVFTKAEVRIADETKPIAHFALAFKGAAWTDPNSIPLMMMQTLLGSWRKNDGGGNFSGSELACTISNGNLAESMMAFNTNYRDTGLFGIYATGLPENLSDLSHALMEGLKRLATDVSETEVARARNQLKSTLLLHIDGTSAVAENNGRQLLTYGRIIPFVELFARIDSVDAGIMKQTARKFIIDKDVAVAAVGPIENLPDCDWFSSRTSLK